MSEKLTSCEHRDFGDYHRVTLGGMPRPTMLAALEGFAREYRRTADLLALDLGCGIGRDTLPLLERGCAVLAIDSDAAALGELGSRAGEAGLAGRLETCSARFETLELPACDLVNASFALPLCPPVLFEPLWQRIRGALRPGGRVAGQLYGPRDSWAARPGITIHDRAEVERLLTGFALEMLDEEESDGNTPRGKPKHWHIWHIVARRAD